jgi:hypothetical protein
MTLRQYYKKVISIVSTEPAPHLAATKALDAQWPKTSSAKCVVPGEAII